MRGRHLLTIGDLSADELARVLETATAFKQSPPARLLEGKELVLIFEKPSTRTRLSFEIGFRRLGGHATYMSDAEVGLGKREAVKDVARVVSRYADAIAARTFSQQTVEELAAWATVPVVNALTDTEHPCQILADLLTIKEHCGGLKGVRLAYIGDGNNVAASLVQGCALSGMHVTLASPDDYGVPKEPLARAEVYAERSGGSITEVQEPADAVRDADIIYTDVWISMGQEREAATRREAFMPYQVTMELLRTAPPGVRIMHDLPAHRGEEITDEVIDSPQSIIFDQAENRLHAQQALMALILGDGRD
ncbi:MAG: ornithine carbamoyltransferase [Dehalococcoidia bacterium]